MTGPLTSSSPTSSSASTSSSEVYRGNDTTQTKRARRNGMDLGVFPQAFILRLLQLPSDTLCDKDREYLEKLQKRNQTPDQQQEAGDRDANCKEPLQKEKVQKVFYACSSGNLDRGKSALCDLGRTSDFQ